MLLEAPEAETYRSVVGILMYFKRHRFDLHYVVKSLAMASSSPTKGHMRRLKRVLRYVQGTRDMYLELIRPREQLTEMVGWCDGSWADVDEKRRSTTGGLLMLGGACVAGWSRTQKPTAMSSGESEFYSANVSACELLWACEFLGWFGKSYHRYYDTEVSHDWIRTAVIAALSQGVLENARNPSK